MRWFKSLTLFPLFWKLQTSLSSMFILDNLYWNSLMENQATPIEPFLLRVDTPRMSPETLRVMSPRVGFHLTLKTFTTLNWCRSKTINCQFADQLWWGPWPTSWSSDLTQQIQTMTQSSTTWLKILLKPKMFTMMTLTRASKTSWEINCSFGTFKQAMSPRGILTREMAVCRSHLREQISRLTLRWTLKIRLVITHGTRDLKETNKMKSLFNETNIL